MFSPAGLVSGTRCVEVAQSRWHLAVVMSGCGMSGCGS